jgi:hypothetical protein
LTRGSTNASASFDNAFASFLTRGFITNCRNIDYAYVNALARDLGYGFGVNNNNNTSINSSARCALQLCPNFGVERSPSTSLKEFLTSANQE